jgi:Rrf2 family transcriptional regulator, nitric oxide-sensitive transcriptional repressor
MKKKAPKTNIFKLNEATSIAIHACVYMAKHMDRNVTATEIATALKASKDHIEKVMQRMSKANLIVAKRGPKGGFMLARDPAKITLLEPFEVTEGEVARDVHCPLGELFCKGETCIMGILFGNLQHQAVEFMSRTMLKDLADDMNPGGFNAG